MSIDGAVSQDCPVPGQNLHSGSNYFLHQRQAPGGGHTDSCDSNGYLKEAEASREGFAYPKEFGVLDPAV
jgi:hypothetical protein